MTGIDCRYYITIIQFVVVVWWGKVDMKSSWQGVVSSDGVVGVS